MLVILLATYPFSVMPSFSKYVLNTIDYAVSVQSVSTYALKTFASISGGAQVEETLTAGVLAPAGATATYQWQKSATPGGVYADIAGATLSTYTLSDDDFDQYIRVVATGFGSYSRSLTSEPTGPVLPAPLTATGAIAGDVQVGKVVTAGDLTPSAATVTYKWQRSLTSGGTFINIASATSNTYMPVQGDIGYYLRVEATGTGGYAGTVISEPAGPVQAIPLVSIGAITGTPAVGGTLTAGQMSPSAATVSYQWQRGSTADGTYADIPEATSSTYDLTSARYGDYIRVTATGTGAYSGTVVSTYVGPAGAGEITAISSIIGSTIVGETLTAGTVTPYGATVDYQWQVSDWNGVNFTNVGTNSNTFAVTSQQSGGYIKVIATGKGAYTGTVSAISLSRVTNPAGTITAIADIGGTAQVGQTLTAGALTPIGSAATYQWQRADTSDGVYSDIIGATQNTYTLGASDYNKYIKVVATGSGSYTGTVQSTSTGLVISCPITDLGSISGTTTVGETLTVGALMPENALVTYQWKRSSTLGGTYEDISGATGSTYMLVTADAGCYLKITVTGTGPYTATLTSGYTGPVGTVALPITAIGNIGGTLQVSQQLSAGSLTPSGATASYQWKRSATADGTYANINGATSSTYTLTTDDYGEYITVMATGMGNYTGTVISDYVGRVEAGVLQSISDIVGSTIIGQTLTAGTVTPIGATVTYQWQASDTGDGSTYEDIVDGIQSTYIVESQWSYRYFRVKVTGTGAYTGTAYSARTATRAASGTPNELTGIAVISGTAQVSETLTAGVLTPSGAAATYQWQRADISGGTYTNIPSATSNSHVLTVSDYNKYIRVSATGSGTYTGIVTSPPLGPVAQRQVDSIGAISGTNTVGQVLTAGVVTPVGATVTYQWKRSASPSGEYANISGATNSTYTLAEGDAGYYLKVAATGTNAYTGAVLSVHTGPVGSSSAPIDGIGPISGTVQVGGQLTAGAASPVGATVSYQWQSSPTASGTYVNIAGAQFSTYTLAPSDYGKYMRVVATGSGSYSGMATSTYTGPVAACPVTAISDIVGSTKFGQTLTAGTVTPPGATVTYQWQKSDTGDGTTFTDMGGATASTYVVESQWSYRYFRVKVTGTGAYSGTVFSARTTTRASSGTPTQITAVGAISGTAQVGSALTAGALTPAEANATYQWQRCDTADGAYTSIPGATSSTYTPVSGDADYYIKVLATGSGNYVGTVASAHMGPIAGISLTDIGSPSGSAQVGQQLAAGSLTPSGATATYRWLRSDAPGGDFAPISGATSSYYILVVGDTGKYIRVEASGSGAYSGIVCSQPIGPIALEVTPLSGIGAISGTLRIGQTVTAGALTPSGATAAYRWMRADDVDGEYSPIDGAVSSGYTLGELDHEKYIKVEAAGTGDYSGTVESASAGPVDVGLLATIGNIDGIPQVGQTLNAGALTPASAAVSYQWQRSDTAGGGYEDISGATGSAYTLIVDDDGKYIKVTATGMGVYSGEVTSAPVGPVFLESTQLEGIGPISGTVEVGQTLTAGALSPADATATYRWLRSAGDGYENITGATGDTYTLVADDIGKLIVVEATGIGEYSGKVTSDPAGPVSAVPLTGIAAISGTVQVGQTLTAGALTSAGATATFRWLRSDTAGGTYETIAGANSTTYTLVVGDFGKYVKVEATGSGEYSGTAISDSVGPVAGVPIDISAITGITVPEKNAVPDTTVDETSQYTATISWSPTHGTFQNETVYTANIVITPKEGYTLNGVAADFFTVAGATSVSNNADSGVVTAVFPPAT